MCIHLHMQTLAICQRYSQWRIWFVLSRVKIKWRTDKAYGQHRIIYFRSCSWQLADQIHTLYDRSQNNATLTTLWEQRLNYKWKPDLSKFESDFGTTFSHNMVKKNAKIKSSYKRVCLWCWLGFWWICNPWFNCLWLWGLAFGFQPMTWDRANPSWQGITTMHYRLGTSSYKL